MSYEHIKANLNLFAVLQNLEDLPKYDPIASDLIKQSNEIIEFWILGGIFASIAIKNGDCKFLISKETSPSIKLFFITPYHFNMMMENKAYPIPLKGLTKLGFLQDTFSKLTEKLEYYLKPGEELLQNKKYLEMNTLLTLNTAVHAAQVLSINDPKGKLIAKQMPDGIILIKIMPDGPAVHLKIKDGIFKAGKGEVSNPSACMLMNDLKVANDLLNNRIDPFSAVACGDINIKGQLPMIDTLNLIFELIPNYLS